MRDEEWVGLFIRLHSLMTLVRPLKPEIYQSDERWAFAFRTWNIIGISAASVGRRSIKYRRNYDITWTQIDSFIISKKKLFVQTSFQIYECVFAVSELGFCPRKHNVFRNRRIWRRKGKRGRNRSRRRSGDRQDSLLRSWCLSHCSRNGGAWLRLGSTSRSVKNNSPVRWWWARF